VDSVKRLKLKVKRLEEENSSDPKSQKKLEMAKEEFSSNDKSLNWIKMKSNLFVLMGFSFVILSILSSTFDGVSVGKLPFHPFGIVTFMSHRNVPGNDMTDMSYIFFYVLCMATCRQNFQKIFGTSPPSGTGSFFPQPA